MCRSSSLLLLPVSNNLGELLVKLDFVFVLLLVLFHHGRKFLCGGNRQRG